MSCGFVEFGLVISGIFMVLRMNRRLREIKAIKSNTKKDLPKWDLPEAKDAATPNHLAEKSGKGAPAAPETETQHYQVSPKSATASKPHHEGDGVKPPPSSES